MDLQQYINRKGVEALLDGRQDRSRGLLEAVRLLLGQHCPEGHGEDEINQNGHGEAYCAGCDEVYSLAQAACEHLRSIGYDVWCEE